MGAATAPMLIRRFLWLGWLLVQGCASEPPVSHSLPLMQAFSLQGRVSVQYDEQSFTGQISWRAERGSDEVLLSTPLGQGIASISRSGQRVMLVRPDQPPVSAENVEDLTQSTLGFRLPLSGLRYWIQARPDPARPRVVRANPAGGAEQIAQDGWKIDYLQYSENRPRKIFVTREGLEIRLIIDEWLTN